MAASTRILSASGWSSSWSIRPVQAAISRAHEIVIAPVAVAASSERVPAQQAHLPDGGLGVLAAEAGFRGEPGGGGGVPVGVVVVGGVEPPHQPVGGRAEQGGDRPELLQGLGPAGAVEAVGGRGVQVRPRPRCRRGARRRRWRSPGRGRPGRIRPVWRAHQQPPPSAGRREHADEAHAVAGIVPWRALARLRPQHSSGTAEPGGSAGVPPGGNPRGRRAFGGRVREGLPSPSYITRSIDGNQMIWTMIIYSISCHLRHRHETEWEMSQAGPFDKTGLICLGILSPGRLG